MGAATGLFRFAAAWGSILPVRECGLGCELEHVSLPMAFDLPHKIFEIRVAPQLVPIFVPLEPRIVVVPECNGTTQKG
jgi:hypothetical protein